MKLRSGRRGAKLAVFALTLVAACKSRVSDPGAGSNTRSAMAGSGAGSAGAGSAGAVSAGAVSAGAGSNTGSAAAVAALSDGKAPELRARELLDQQVAALAGHDNAALLAMFAPGAVVLVPAARLVEPSLDLVGGIAGLDPAAPGAGAKITAEITKVAVGSTDAAIWVDAELAIAVASSDQAHATHAVRAVELLDGAKGWKVAVASFARTANARRGSSAPDLVPAPTDPGPLSALLAAPPQLATSLLEDEDATVFALGTEASERGVGLVDAKLLAYKWGKRKPELDARLQVHEVRTPAWGYATGVVSWPGAPAPARTSGLVIAIPVRSGGWATVAAVYNAL